MKELKKLVWDDIIKDGLEGDSGTIYKISASLNMDRFVKAEELIPQLEFGINMQSLGKELQNVANEFNKTGQMAGQVALSRTIDKVSGWSQRGNTAAKICALYLNEEDEDRTIATDEMIDKKLADWRGFEYTGFFQLCSSLISFLKESIEENAANGSI